MNKLSSLYILFFTLALSGCDNDRIIELEWIVENNSEGIINITSKLPFETETEFNSISTQTELLLFTCLLYTSPSPRDS